MTPERRAEIEALALPLHPDVVGIAGRYGIARLSSFGQASIIHELLAEIDRLSELHTISDEPGKIIFFDEPPV